ncbi:hypothetical protein [Undibacterium terreum]|uniref:Uncharacterized protein n=1 Tax=Undibacterium terreum TaxID=1224302 RepID=A0A916UHR3_9BURK|nr:hypothetical protein [Undibacterium terreum]GGC73444.1 hypothetical protein GCM10011396_20780 [Undibacterium terreum]
MKFKFRKNSGKIRLLYSDGSFGSNIIGHDIGLEQIGSTLYLTVYLEENLSSDRVGQACQRELLSFFLKPALLLSCELQNAEISEELCVFWRQNPQSIWQLHLLHKERGAYVYDVTPLQVLFSVSLKVRQFTGIQVIANNDREYLSSHSSITIL